MLCPAADPIEGEVLAVGNTTLLRLRRPGSTTVNIVAAAPREFGPSTLAPVWLLADRWRE